MSVTDFVRDFADQINRVVYRGEQLVLVRGGRELAEVRPRVGGRPLRSLPELLAALPHLGEEEAASLGADVAAARAALGGLPDGTAWPS